MQPSNQSESLIIQEDMGNLFIKHIIDKLAPPEILMVVQIKHDGSSPITGIQFSLETWWPRTMFSIPYDHEIIMHSLASHQVSIGVVKIDNSQLKTC